MTFIQPSKHKNIFTGLIIGLFMIVAFGIFGMITLYNATVNVSHNIADAKKELEAVGAETTDLSNKISNIMSRSEIAKFASQGGLVAESKPQYLPIARATEGQ